MRLLLVLLMLLPDCYLWHHFLRHAPLVVQVVWFAPFLLSTALIVLMMTPFGEPWMFRVLACLLLCFFLPKVFFLLPSLAGLALRWLSPVAWKVGNMVGLIAALSMACVVAYGMAEGWKRLVVREVTLCFDTLPKAFDGYRIVHLSDFHIGTYSTAPEVVSEVVEKVNALHGDMVCFTGDIVNSSPDELQPFLPVLRRLYAADGVFSIMGNHDYCLYHPYGSERERCAAVSRLQDYQRQMGWTLLMNEYCLVSRSGETIALAGVENAGKPPFPDRSDLSRALTSHKLPEQEAIRPLPDSIVLSDSCSESHVAPSSLFTILMSHDPTHWRREVLQKSSVDLQLSGHTHATQFRMFGLSPAAFIYDEYAGAYEYNGSLSLPIVSASGSSSLRKLFVSTGVGSNVPFRFGVWPEIVVVTLRSGKGG